MKEVITYKDIATMERDYLQRNIPWIIEKKILEGFPKKELKHFIEKWWKDYMKESMPYSYWVSRKQFREWYDDLKPLERYFIEQYSHIFKWGKELEMNKNFLKKLKQYYKEQYEISASYRRDNFDIHSLSIVEVISRYTSLPKNLRRNIRCLLHTDKTASFRIYPNTQSFYCFGCHKWGNAVNFVSEIENISTKEAFKKLANLYTK